MERQRERDRERVRRGAIDRERWTERIIDKEVHALHKTHIKMGISR